MCNSIRSVYYNKINKPFISFYIPPILNDTDSFIFVNEYAMYKTNDKIITNIVILLLVL